MNDTRIESFDYLRLLAMALVTIQHALAVHGYYDQTTWGGVNVGQTGVAIFCALSGYLAFRLDLNKPLVWFRRRLVQIFPAYWIVTIVSFALTLIAGSKDVTWSLFVSQMLGTGFFTHGWELVNVVSWFVSLILLCYVIALVAYMSGHVSPILLVVIGVCGGLLYAKGEVDLSRHVVTFALAGLIATQRIPAAMIAILGAAGFALAVFVSIQFVYVSFALVFLCLALVWKARGYPLTRIANTYTYEFFLVHGVFLVVFSRLIAGAAVASVFVALCVAVVAAVILGHFVSYLSKVVPVYTRFRAS